MAWWTIDAARDLSSRVAGAAAWVTWGRHGRTPCRWERREAGDSVQPPLPSDSDPLWTVICRLRSVVGQSAVSSKQATAALHNDERTVAAVHMHALQ
jgi:hypothetical protein